LAEEIVIRYLSASEVSYIVHDLKSQGLVIHKDFDFFYHPPQQPKWDDETNKFVPKHTKFVFHEGKWATWFALKYGQ
jgi:hypothetical protein